MKLQVLIQLYKFLRLRAPKLPILNTTGAFGSKQNDIITFRHGQ